jgi:capsid portal protein
MPPAIIFIQGGALVGGVREQLDNFLSGKASMKHRAAIVEVASTSGTLDSAGSVQVKVERFGSSATDFLFQKYDDQTKEHIRMSFRLAPILIGSSTDYNYATSLSSIRACESQVFQPERFEFDEKINNTLMKALGAKRYRFSSKSTVFADSTTQLQSMVHAAKVLGGKEVIDTLNEITGLKMEYDESKDPAQQQQQQQPQEGMGEAEAPQMEQGQPPDPTQPTSNSDNVASSPMASYPQSPMGAEDLGQPPPTGANAKY